MNIFKTFSFTWQQGLFSKWGVSVLICCPFSREETKFLPQLKPHSCLIGADGGQFCRAR